MAQGPASNLLASLRRVFGTLIAMGRTRFELLVVEFEEERARLGVLLLLGALTFLCLMLGIILVNFLIIVAFWDTYRLHSVVVLAIVYLLVAFVLWRMVVAKAREQPRLFSATLEELRRDESQLRSDEKGGA